MNARRRFLRLTRHGITGGRMDLIRIRGLEMDCIVGVRPLEREREQRVHLDLAFGLDLSKAGRTGRIALTCDYSEIAEEVIAMLRFRRYHLIEMATEELSAMLLSTHPPMEFVEIRLDKPAALDGKARAASVEVHRSRLAFPMKRRDTDYGATETVLVTREASLHLVRVEAGRSVELPVEGETLGWVVSGELSQGGVAIPRHVPETHARVGALVNTGDEPAVLFRCICPPAQETDG